MRSRGVVFVCGNGPDSAQHRRVVNVSHINLGDVAGYREGAGLGVVGGGVGLGADVAGGLVPGLVGDGGGAAVVAVWHETHRIGSAEQQGAGFRYRAHGLPGRAAVGRELPHPVGGILQAGDGNALYCAVVYIGDAGFVVGRSAVNEAADLVG